MSIGRLILGSLLLIGVAAPSASGQQSLYVDFEGVIVEIYDPFGYTPPTWEVGDTMPGFFSYQLDAVDTEPNPSIGTYVYWAQPTGLRVGGKGYVYMSDTAAIYVRLRVSNDLAGGGQLWDGYQYHSQINLLEPEVLGIGAGPIILQLDDSTGTALQDDSLPQGAPFLGDWTYRAHLVIHGEVTYWIVMDITSFAASTPSGIEPIPSGSIRLSQNYPNPFNLVTTVSFGLTQPDKVMLAVYDVAGRLVATLVDSSFEPGDYAFAWDGRSAYGRRVASGVYFCVLTADNQRESRRMIVVR